VYIQVNSAPFLSGDSFYEFDFFFCSFSVYSKKISSILGDLGCIFCERIFCLGHLLTHQSYMAWSPHDMPGIMHMHSGVSGLQWFPHVRLPICLLLKCATIQQPRVKNMEAGWVALS